MNRNRNTADPPMKQSSIASISSHVPLLSTSSDADAHHLTQAMVHTNTDVQNFLDSMKTNTNRDPKRARTVCQPKGTVAYTVANSDTLEKIALHFNATPSELLHLNKLHSRMVFPGQILYVPDESSANATEQQASPPLPIVPPTSATKAKDGDAFILLTDRRLSGESSSSPPPPSSGTQQQHQQDVGQMVWSMARQSAAKPGRAERLKSEPSVDSDSSPRTIEERLKTQKEDNSKQVQQIQKTLSNEENRQLDEECLQRFLKVNVRLMTDDHKSVAGTLLVTPNALMFDPDVLDPSVKENGIERYGLIIRMDLLAGIALYEDLAMYEHEAKQRDEEKRRMVHSISVKSLQRCAIKTSSSDEEQIRDLLSSMIGQIEKEAEPSQPSPESPLLLFDVASPVHRAVSTDLEFYPTSSIDGQDLFQPLDDYKHSVGVLFEDKDLPQVSAQISDNFSWMQFLRAIRVHKENHWENCVSLGEFNKRFGEIDKLLQKQQEIYVTPHPIEIPYYLCIKISPHTNEKMSGSARSTGSSMEVTSGKKELDLEYWFSVPKEKIGHLHAFFLRWTPEREPESSSKSDQSVTTSISSNQITRTPSHNQAKPKETPSAKGFVLLNNDDSESTEDYLATENKTTPTTRSRTPTSSSAESSKEQKKSHYLKRQNTLLKEWEIINVEEIYRRLNATQANNAYLQDISAVPAPKLLQPSTLLDEQQCKEILLELPARVHGMEWQLLFSTEKHGFSLNQLYRRALQLDQDAPSLLIVRDVEQNIFGAYVSQQIVVSEGFYGTGESFLFSFYPHFQFFKWTGHNQFFVKGDVKALGFGSGEGTYGLWLDADLYHGRTCPSKTFNNVRLSSTEDFIVASVEVWTFVD